MKIKLILLCLLLGISPAWSQAFVRGQAQTLPSTNSSVIITTGLTYQLLLAASTTRHSLTIENNQTSGTDLCYILYGSNVTVVAGTTTTSSTSIVTGASSLTAAQVSITIGPQQAFTRYWPNIPQEAIYVTCATTSDSLYADVQ
jgi:hypothetical protein